MKSVASLLDLFRRGRITRYDKGWVPGPDAMWQKRSPDDMARSLSTTHANKPAPASSPEPSKPSIVPKEQPKESSPPVATPSPEEIGKMDDGQLAKLIESSPEKPKRVRDRSKENSGSLREIVKRLGGISINSLEAHGYDVKALKENGLAWRGLMKREGGRDISEIAAELHNEGHVEIPGVQQHGEEVKGVGASKTLPKEAPEFILDQLVNKVKSLHAIKDNEFKASYDAFVKEERDARKYASQSEVEEVVRRGEEDGTAEGANEDLLADDSELAEEGGSQADESGATDVGDFDPQKMASPDEMAKSLQTPAAPASGEMSSPDEMAKSLAAPKISEPEAMHLFSSLPVDEETGYPKIVTDGASWFKKKNPGVDIDDLQSSAAEAVMKTARSMKAGETPEQFKHKAMAAIKNAHVDLTRKETAQVRGKDRTQPIGESNPAEPKSQPAKGEVDANAIREVVSKMSPELQIVADGMMNERSNAEIAAELGISVTDTKRLAAMKEKVAQAFESVGDFGKLLHEMRGGKQRYSRGPLMPDVWAEILQQARSYGMMGPEFVRAVMEAMQHSDSQWDAIVQGRRAFLSKGSQRYERSPDKPHKFSSTQFNIKGPEAKTILAMAAKIPDDELADDGREDKPHITVKFGIHADDDREISKLVGDFGPVKVTLGKTFIFPAKGDANFDVVNIEVSSARLHRLNALISESVECTDTHPKYIPHVCLAYVKAGEGKKYVDDDTAEGITLTFDSLTFSDKLREHSQLTLQKPRSYGARHQSGKRAEGAVARLCALAEYASEIDDEALEDEVTGIAREFSADDLRAIAKKFGVKKGISTKAATLEALLVKVCKGAKEAA